MKKELRYTSGGYTTRARIVKGENGRDKLYDYVAGKARFIDCQFIRDIAAAIGYPGIDTLKAWSMPSVKMQVITSLQK